jgi:hypothetical protein
LISTYFILKIALRAVVDECNKIAVEAETQAQAAQIKARIAQLELEFAQGKIDQGTYTAMASEILRGLSLPNRSDSPPTGGG